MHTEDVEIYSNTPNRVVLRVPWRRYPAALIQGDELSTLSAQADKACAVLLKHIRRDEMDNEEDMAISGLISLRDELRSLLQHYDRVTTGFTPGSPSVHFHDIRHTAATRALKKHRNPEST
jgi:hypothetical protein